MNEQQAWQATIGQLQMEMPKASFDTWVKDAQLLTCENGVFNEQDDGGAEFAHGGRGRHREPQEKRLGIVG
jgi:hypothetical protein